MVFWQVDGVGNGRVRGPVLDEVLRGGSASISTFIQGDVRAGTVTLFFYSYRKESIGLVRAALNA